MDIPQWEYDVTDQYLYNNDEMADYLNSRGERGWELVSQEYIQDGRYRLTFKRPL